MMKLRFLILTAFLAFGLTVAPANGILAGEPINTDQDGVAISGYDPVAYFRLGEAVEGSPTHSYNWQSAEWHFATAEHRNLFAADPEQFAPRYGGHCAGAMALGRMATVDPEAWAIVDGKLYLNFRKAGRDLFVADPDQKIADADAHWETLREAE